MEKHDFPIYFPAASAAAAAEPAAAAAFDACLGSFAGVVGSRLGQLVPDHPPSKASKLETLLLPSPYSDHSAIQTLVEY